MENTIVVRSKTLAVDIIRLCRHIPRNEATIVISRQLLRSATSVGANYRSALRGKSKADFIMKLNIAEEEADETVYWLELLAESEPGLHRQVQPLLNESRELTAILTASGKTARKNLNRKIS